MGINEAVVLAVPTVGVIVWLVRLEGRINGHDQLLSALRDDVRYIRNRIDRALNGHVRDEE